MVIRNLHLTNGNRQTPYKKNKTSRWDRNFACKEIVVVTKKSLSCVISLYYTLGFCMYEEGHVYFIALTYLHLFLLNWVGFIIYLAGLEIVLILTLLSPTSRYFLFIYRCYEIFEKTLYNSFLNCKVSIKIIARVLIQLKNLK
jgi:hypothetical protein